MQRIRDRNKLKTVIFSTKYTPEQKKKIARQYYERYLKVEEDYSSILDGGLGV